MNPNQVLLSIKNCVHSQQLVTGADHGRLPVEFGRISKHVPDGRRRSRRGALYRKITGWEIDLSESTDQSIKEVLTYQKSEANQEFCKFVRRNYYNWINKRLGRRTP